METEDKSMPDDGSDDGSGDSGGGGGFWSWLVTTIQSWFSGGGDGTDDGGQQAGAASSNHTATPYGTQTTTKDGDADTVAVPPTSPTTASPAGTDAGGVTVTPGELTL